MKTLKGIRRHIQSVKSTQKITRAMKLVAAARLRRAQMKALNSRVYTKELYGMVQNISRRAGPKAPPLMRRPTELKNIDALVITSDRGLCGGFNENLLAAVDEDIYEHTSHGIDVSIFMAGRKGWDHLAGKYKLLTKVENINPEFGNSTAERVARLFAQRYVNQESSGAFMVFNRFESAVLQRVTIWNYLPLYWRMPAKEYAVDYIFEPEREDLLNHIIEQFLVHSVEQAFLESRAAELAARMTAMDNATKNAEDMIAHLTLEYHKARQQAITMELLDIVGGAEALK